MISSLIIQVLIITLFMTISVRSRWVPSHQMCRKTSFILSNTQFLRPPTLLSSIMEFPFLFLLLFFMAEKDRLFERCHHICFSPSCLNLIKCKGQFHHNNHPLPWYCCHIRPPFLTLWPLARPGRGKSWLVQRHSCQRLLSRISFPSPSKTFLKVKPWPCRLRVGFDIGLKGAALSQERGIFSNIGTAINANALLDIRLCGYRPLAFDPYHFVSSIASM